MVLVFIAACALFYVTVIRSQHLVDKTGPEITMDTASITVSVTDSEEELLKGITASDSKDGDVTSSLLVESMTNFIEKGRREVVIDAFDHDGHVTKTTREIVYSDYESPRFEISGPLRFSLGDQQDPAELVTVTDCLDGDLSGDVVMSADEYISDTTAGTYSVRISVSNSAGDVAELPVTLEYYDAVLNNGVPHVLLSQYIVYLKKGDHFSPSSYIEGVEKGSVTYTKSDMVSEEAVYTMDDISIDHSVNPSEAGVYEAEYSMEGDNSYKSTIRLIVVVED